MINHHWTLLMNEPGSHVPPEGCDWDRYIPETFTPVRYSSALSQVRQALLGRGTYYDRAYRGDELMRLCLQPKYIPLMDWPDKRRIEPVANIVTYPFGISTDQLSGTAKLWLKFGQNLWTGTIRRYWRIAVVSPVVQVVYPNGTTREFQAAADLEIPLDRALTGLIPNPVDGAAWAVTVILRPPSTFVSIMQAVRALPDGPLMEVQAEALDTSPNPDQLNALYASRYDEDRLAGLSLMVVAAAENQRQSNT